MLAVAMSVETLRLVFTLLWIGTAAVGILWILHVLRQARLECRRQRDGRCLRCGYDLRASQGRCPECGEKISRS